MIGQKIEKLIEESFTQNENDFIYHYGGPGYKELKNRRMLGLSLPKDVSNDSYLDTFSAFLAPLSKDQIQKFRNSGFKAWKAVPLPIYEYKIKVSDNIDSFNGPITFTSLPEEVSSDFRNSVWADYLKTKGIDFKKMYEDDNYWKEIKDSYIKEAKSPIYNKLLGEWFKSKFGSEVTAQNFATHPFIRRVKKNFNKYVGQNLRKGNKNQYATFIPHIYTKIKKPIKIYSSKKIM